MTATRREHRLATLWQRQHGVATRRQLVVLGIDTTTIDRRVASGQWHRPYPCVIGPSGVPRTWWTRVWSAMLAAPPGSVLYGRTAARVHGVLEVSDRAPIEITGSRCWNLATSLRDVAYHRTRKLPTREVQFREHLPVTTPARTCMDLATCSSRRQLEQGVDEFVRRKKVTRLELEEVLGTRRRGRGRGIYREVIATIPEGMDRARSALERLGLRHLSMGGHRGYAVNAPVRDEDGDLVAVVDVLLANAPLVIEWDGERWHGAFTKITDDLARQRRIEATGLTVVRASWDDVVSGRFIRDLDARLRRLGSR